MRTGGWLPPGLQVNDAEIVYRYDVRYEPVVVTDDSGLSGVTESKLYHHRIAGIVIMTHGINYAC